MSNVKGLDGLFIPPGRFIMGSLTEKNTTDFANQPIPLEKQAYFFGVAVPKSDPNVQGIIGQLYQMAVNHYQQAPMVMAQIQQGLGAKDFAWKIDDGDVPQYDQNTGAPREISEYRKGCYIFKFGTMFDVGACNREGVDINRADIKRGDYIDVKFNSQPNGKVDDTAGIYLNPVAVRLLGYGDPISSGVSASTAFGGHAAVMPQGASEVPTAGGAVPPTQGQPQSPMPPAQPAPVPMPQASAGTMPAPDGAQQPTAYPTSAHPGILQPQAGEQVAPTPAPATAGSGMPGV